MRDLDGRILDQLFELAQSRKGGDPEVSYTAKLLSKGTAKITKKLGEEAVEAVIAALEGDREEVVKESADVLYHLMVLWADQGIEAADVWAELGKRQGISGIEEKKNRKGENG